MGLFAQMARKGVLLLAALAANQAFAVPPVVGEVAPDFHVTTFDGKDLTLADFKGQVLIVNFWATWCEPCKQELPLLDAYFRAQEKAGLRVVAITTEDSLPLRQLRPLARAVGFPMVRNYSGRYGVLHGVPTNYVIDRAGVVRYARSGGFTLDGLNKILVPLLREPVPPSSDPAAGAKADASNAEVKPAT